jgi:hypothetical protein
VPNARIDACHVNANEAPAQRSRSCNVHISGRPAQRFSLEMLLSVVPPHDAHTIGTGWPNVLPGEMVLRVRIPVQAHDPRPRAVT